jgi:hypothetical protein
MLSAASYIICYITEFPYTNIPNSWAKLQEKYVKGLEQDAAN